MEYRNIRTWFCSEYQNIFLYSNSEFANTLFSYRENISITLVFNDVSIHSCNLGFTLSSTEAKEPTVDIILPLQMCVHMWFCACVHVYMCALDTHIHTLKLLFCQVGCQSLTGVSTSVFRFGVSCSCSFLREDVLSKVNIWSESSLSHMQLALKKGPDHMLSVYTGMQSEDLLYS